MSRCLEGLLLLALSVPAGCGAAKTDKDDDRSDDAQPADPATIPPPEDEPGKDPKPTTEPGPLRGVESIDSVYRVDVEWFDGPDFENENNRGRLVFFDAAGKAATSVSVQDFHAWMTSMGHGAPTIDLEIVAEADRPDAMLVSGLMFTMGGAWDLKFDATVNGTRAKASFPVDVPK